MKKLLMGLLLLGMIFSLIACGGPAVSESGPAPDTTVHTAPPADPEEPAAQVRILNTDPALQQIWDDMAQKYSDLTGVDVKIVTSASDKPTLRRVTGQDELPENCIDLSQTNACAQLISQELTLRNENGEVLAVADHIEVYGLMYNSTLLAKTANTRDDINSFTDLTEVVYSITDAKATLGFSAFSRVDLDDYFALQIAALNGGGRSLVELILNNTTVDPMTAQKGTKAEALQEFLDGKAVFFLAGTAEQEVLATIGSENIGVLPVYMGGKGEEKQTLCVAPRSYWCVDGSHSAADVQATVDFLEYLTGPKDGGGVPADELKRVAPYRQATYVSNVPEMVLRMELAMGKEPVVCRYVDRVPHGLVEALAAYAADPSDDNWAAIGDILTQ